MSGLYELLNYVMNTHPPDERTLDGFLGEGVRKVSYQRGQPITSPLDRAKSCFIIYEGECEGVQWSADGIKDTYPIRKLPEITGEASMVNHLPRYTNNVLAVGNLVKAIEVDNDYFFSELQRDTRLCILLLQDISIKLVGVSRKVIHRHFYTAKENFLLFVYERWLHSGGRLPFVLSQSNRAIADELGVSERTLYRALNEFSHQGLLRVEDGNLVLDTAMAKKLAARAEALMNINY